MVAERCDLRGGVVLTLFVIKPDETSFGFVVCDLTDIQELAGPSTRTRDQRRVTLGRNIQLRMMRPRKWVPK